MKTILNVEQVAVSYGRQRVLENISFQVQQGDYVGIVGPNGSGKTTLIRAILGLIPTSQGHIDFGNGLKASRAKIGFLPQVAITTDTLFPARVQEIVEMGLLSQKTFPKFLHRADREKVDQIMTDLRISHLKRKKIGELSGGQQQRVLLARAMVGNPELLILDEPTSALDPKIRGEFYELIGKLNRERNVTILLVSHDIGSIGQYTNKMLYLDGKVIFYGDYKDFCLSNAMTEYFGFETQHKMCWQHGAKPHHHETSAEYAPSLAQLNTGGDSNDS